MSGDDEKALERELSSRIEEDAASVSPLSFRSEILDSPLGCLASPIRPSLSAMATKLVRTLERGRGDPEALVLIETPPGLLPLSSGAPSFSCIAICSILLILSRTLMVTAVILKQWVSNISRFKEDSCKKENEGGGGGGSGRTNRESKGCNVSRRTTSAGQKVQSQARLSLVHATQRIGKNGKGVGI